MSVYKPAKSPFYHFDFWLEGVRFTGSTERAAKSEARKVEARKKDEAKLEIERHRIDPNAPMTIGVAIDRYWEEVGRHHVGAKTTGVNLDRIQKFFGPARKLSSITDDDVAKLVAWRRGQSARYLERFVTPATVNRTTTEVLQKVFNRAVSKWKVILPNAPSWAKHMLPEPAERVREVREAEETSFEAIRADYLPIIAFARASGLRMAECILRKEDVDLFGGHVRTTGKGGKAIRQPITDEMRAILMAEMANPTEYVFTFAAARIGRLGRTHKRGDRLPITLSGLKTAWRRARQSGLPADLRFHDLRHDFATKLLRETGNLKLVSKALHHSKLETTNRYAHVLDEEILAGMEAASRSRKPMAARESPSRVPEKVPDRKGKIA